MLQQRLYHTCRLCNTSELLPVLQRCLGMQLHLDEPTYNGTMDNTLAGQLLRSFYNTLAGPYKACTGWLQALERTLMTPPIASSSPAHCKAQLVNGWPCVRVANPTQLMANCERQP